MVDKSTHTHIAEVGGVCFCAVEIRKPTKSINKDTKKMSVSGDHPSKQNCLVNPPSSQRLTEQGHYDVPRPLGSAFSRAPNMPRHREHPLSGDHRQPPQSGDHRQPPKSGDHRHTVQSGDHRQPPQIGDHRQPLQSGDHRQLPQCGDHRQSLQSGNHASSTKSDPQRHCLRASSEESSDDDTPTATPTPEDNEARVTKSFSTQGCQTERSVLKQDSPGGSPGGGRGGLHSHDRDGDYRDVQDRELVRTSMEHIPEPKRTSKNGGLRSKKSRVSSGYDVTKSVDIPPEPIERPPSVTSLISMTDTMSVTSLEVANIMAVSSKEDKKSAVKLEKERLQLQHQRLESYQLACQEDSLQRQPWPDKGRKPYSEESLKKQKILKSVFEALPSSSATGTENQSHLHSFVTQSLESFFTGASKKPSKAQESNEGENGVSVKGNHSHGNPQRIDPSRGQGSTGSGYTNASASPNSPRHGDLPAAMPSLFQLTASFRLFHVTYGDWTDLRNLRLYLSDLLLEENSRSPSNSSRSPGSSSRSSGSPGARSVASVLSADSGAFRAVGKNSPAGHYTFMIISNLGNPRMELDPGGLKVGDHIIEVSVKTFFPESLC